MSADLVGYDPEKVGGAFTFGGTGAMLYAAKVGLEKRSPARYVMDFARTPSF